MGTTWVSPPTFIGASGFPRSPESGRASNSRFANQNGKWAQLRPYGAIQSTPTVALLGRNLIARGVIVQATTYGADHQIVLDGLAAAGAGYRGCANAIVLRETDDAYVSKLHDAGIRGARFSRPGLGASLSPEDMPGALARVKELGWYVKIQPEAGGISSGIEPFEKLDFPVLIDHMGRPVPAAGEADPNLRKMLELMSRGNFWVMLSLGEKTSKTGYPWDDVVPVARRLIAAAPDRCIWGSNWPHPLSTKQPPNDAELVELVARYAADVATLQKILVDNPARFFGFAN
jgi:2-pyrone-4,6-dicarboxylate lactonase